MFLRSPRFALLSGSSSALFRAVGRCFGHDSPAADGCVLSCLIFLVMCLQFCSLCCSSAALALDLEARRILLLVVVLGRVASAAAFCRLFIAFILSSCSSPGRFLPICFDGGAATAVRAG